MLENIRLSFQGVWSHRLRSFLTMLGIIIGIAAIIAIVSTIKGTNEQIKKNLIGSGTNTTTVQLTEEGNYPAEMEYGIPKGIPVLDDDMRQQLADIDHDVRVISPEAIEPIQKVKTEYLGSKNPRLHLDEVLIALSISAATNADAERALHQVPKLKGCQAHTSVMLSDVDVISFRKLGIELTCEAKAEKKKKYQKD